jgi:hypothetical protein
VLGWGEWRAQKVGLVKLEPAEAIIKDDAGEGAGGFFKNVAKFARDMDVMGLLLLGTGWALLLVALTLSAGANGVWSNRKFHAVVSRFGLDANSTVVQRSVSL